MHHLVSSVCMMNYESLEECDVSDQDLVIYALSAALSASALMVCYPRLVQMMCYRQEQSVQGLSLTVAAA